MTTICRIEIMLDNEGNVLVAFEDYIDNDVHIAKYSSSGELQDHVEFSVAENTIPIEFKYLGDSIVQFSGRASARNSSRSNGFLATVDIQSPSISEEYMPDDEVNVNSSA